MRAIHTVFLSLTGLLFCLPAQAQTTDSDGDGVADSQDAFPNDPAAVAAAYYPAQGSMAMMMFEQMSTNVVDSPMPRPLKAVVVTANVGQSPSKSTKTGLSFQSPFFISSSTVVLLGIARLVFSHGFGCG